MIQVSIIIVNYNTKLLLSNCINSVIQHTFNLVYEIIVVDNGSTDGSVEMLQEDFANVVLVAANENLGFGKGNNRGVDVAKGDFIFLLNSDTLLIENSVFDLYQFFTNNENKLNIGAIGCKLVDLELNVCNSAGSFPLVINDIKKYYYSFKNKLFKTSFELIDIYDFNTPFFEVGFVSGADLMLKRTTYKNLKGFDERFFMYYEETDLQYRLRKMGFQCYIITSTKIIHLEGGSINERKYSNFKRIINQVSRNYYFKKNDTKMYLLHVFFDIIMNVIRIFNRNYTLKENFNFVLKNIKSY
ncbi:glycosyltransferase family 2 protein [Flavobacterium sp. RS13.1]|uniref:glycosyltransferase family 2 protein n=1 Tax=Flavobacterium sp. RS13.1 TaxID=3400345 RepID=UPI003AAFB822